MRHYTYFLLLFICSGINAQITFEEPQLFFSTKKFNQNANWMLNMANTMMQDRNRFSTVNTQADSLHHYMDYGGQAHFLLKYHILYSEVNGTRLPVEIRGRSEFPGDRSVIKLQYDQDNRIILVDFFQGSGTDDTTYIGYYENRFDTNGRLIFKYFDLMLEPGDHYIQGDSLFIEYDEFGRDSLYSFYRIINPPYEWQYIISADNFLYDSEDNLTAIEFFREGNLIHRDRYSEMLWYGGYENQVNNLFLFNELTFDVHVDIANDIIPEAEQKHRMEPIQYNKYYKDGGGWQLLESRELVSLSDTLIECNLISNGELIYKEEFRIKDNLLLQFDEFEFNNETEEWETSKQIINNYNDYGLIEEVFEYNPSLDLFPQLNFSTSYEIDSEGNLLQFEYLDHNDEFRRGTYFYNTTSIYDSGLSNSQITLSPNPAGNSITLNFQDLPFQEIRYKILSIEGNQMQSGILHTQQNPEINLLYIPSGIYFFQWFGGSNEGVVKLIRE